MTCAQFIKRLSGLNDGGNFPVELLRRLYSAIKGAHWRHSRLSCTPLARSNNPTIDYLMADQPLEWASDSVENAADRDVESNGNPMEMAAPKEMPSNPYLDIPSPVQSQEFKKGYIMRKCCLEPNGKRTALGKRSWRMYFAVLKDLVLYLYKDEASCKGEMPPKMSKSSSSSAARKKDNQSTDVGDKEPAPAALIRVHHALAANAPDYTKKQNVFRLFTADRAQFLVQTSDAKVSRSLEAT